MRSPAVAIAWEFRQRHRWGLIAVTGSVLVIATIKFLERPSINVDNVLSFALMVAVPDTGSLTRNSRCAAASNLPSGGHWD